MVAEPAFRVGFPPDSPETAGISTFRRFIAPFSYNEAARSGRFADLPLRFCRTDDSLRPRFLFRSQENVQFAIDSGDPNVC